MEAIARITLFNNLFYVCAGIAVLSLLLAVYFFIQFDIPSVYAALTGKKRKRSIQRMRAQSQAGKTMHSRVRRKPSSGTPPTGQTVPPRKRPEPPAEPPRPEPKPEPGPKPAQRPETGVLKVETPQTQVLPPMGQEKKAPITEELAPTELLTGRQPFAFLITENTICVHTDEWIS